MTMRDDCDGEAVRASPAGLDCSARAGRAPCTCGSGSWWCSAWRATSS